jgi:radical SAM protein with 4Fe4S-binding SPASM domain
MMKKKRRSAVSADAIIKGARILVPHPYIGIKLARIQMEKTFFPLLNPRRKSGYARKIHQLSIRITDLCNLRCHTCGQWGDNGFLHGCNPGELKGREVGGGRYLELFDDLVRHGHRPNVYIWGGEPTMYSSLLDVLNGAAKRKMPTSIVSNGYGVARLAEELIKSKLYLLQLSIDGHNSEIHNGLRPATGNGDAFNDILNGLQTVYECKKGRPGLPIVASLTVISKQNMHHLVDIYHRFKKYVDIFVFYPSWWIDEEQAGRHVTDFQGRFGFEPQLHRGWIGSWKPDEYETLAEQIKELKSLSRSLSSPSVTFIPDIMNHRDLENYYTDHQETFGFDECVSIFQAVELDSNGDMSPCRDYHDYVVGNVKENTIVELWNSESYLKFRKSLQKDGLMPVCSRCCGLMGY